MDLNDIRYCIKCLLANDDEKKGYLESLVKMGRRLELDERKKNGLVIAETGEDADGAPIVCLFLWDRFDDRRVPIVFELDSLSEDLPEFVEFVEKYDSADRGAYHFLVSKALAEAKRIMESESISCDVWEAVHCHYKSSAYGDGFKYINLLHDGFAHGDEFDEVLAQFENQTEGETK